MPQDSPADLAVVAAPEAPSSSTHTPRFLLLAVILFGVVLRLYFFEPGLARSPDERTCTFQANMTLAHGTAGLRFLVQQLARNPAVYAQEPSPLRIGYIYPLAAFMRFTDDRSAFAGAQLSLLSSFAALLLLAFTAYRALSPPVAILATLFYAVLPFELTTSRRAWQDSFIAFLAIAVLSLAVSISRTHGLRRAASFGAFAFLGVLSIVTKENFGIFFMLCAAGLTLHFILNRDRRSAIATALCAAASAIVSAAILASISGGLAAYVAVEAGFARYSGLGPYEVQFDTGPVWMFPAALFRTCPVLSLAALAGFSLVVYGAVRRRTIASADFPLGLALISLLMLLIQVITGRYNLRYTAPVYGSICLLGGIGLTASLQPLHKLLVPLGRPAAAAILGFALAVAALRDLNFARDKFLSTGMQDLSVRFVLDVLPEVIPAHNAH